MKRFHYFIAVAVTATVSATITYVIVAKQPSDCTMTSYVEKAPESQEPEV